MRSDTLNRLVILIAAGAAVLAAQEVPLPSGSISINLPKDSPLAVLSMTSDQSRASARGAAWLLDLHMSLTLRNISSNRIHGVRLRVVAQEATPGGIGSVTMPSLNVGPNEAFPIRIDMQLVRPTQMAGGPPLQVDLDGVLYQDLSFYGPNRLKNSQRYLTACELEAQRDREYFKRVLAQGGKDALRQEMLQSIARQAEVPSLNVKVVRSPAVTNAAVANERSAQFALVRFPDAPVELVQGSAVVSANEARTPVVEVRNTSGKAVKYVELGWILSDSSGRQSTAAWLPPSDPVLYLPAGKSAQVRQDNALRLFAGNQPVNVQKMTSFVNQVEFADGKMWVPSRQNMQSPELLRGVTPSAEEQRLGDIYRKKSLEGLIEELKKF